MATRVPFAKRAVYAIRKVTHFGVEHCGKA